MPGAAGLRFRETMSGRVTLGESDYRQGAEAVGTSGNKLALHATVTIDDLNRFIDDPQHFGQLEGSIEYQPFGGEISGYDGRFNLFSPAGEPETKLMIYELAFEHDGEAYYLAGRKEVHDDPGFDLWSDTTTLFTYLHRGADSRGEVVAAGVLTLELSDLMRLLSSMEVLNASSAVEKFESLARFGRFFMGELWDSYAGLAL